MITGLLIFTLICALKAVRSTHLLDAVLWLAAVSAGVAVMLYAIGGWEIAVIELSVGTGLVTVLMVFAITMVGDEVHPVTPQRALLALVLVAIVMFMLLTVPYAQSLPTTDTETVSEMLWQARKLDMLIQIALIFTGVLGLLGLSSAATQSTSSTQALTKASKTEVV